MTSTVKGYECLHPSSSLRFGARRTEISEIRRMVRSTRVLTLLRTRLSEVVRSSGSIAIMFNEKKKKKKLIPPFEVYEELGTILEE